MIENNGEWMRLALVAEELELSQTILSKWRKIKKTPDGLEYKKVGRFFYYLTASVEAYIKAHKVFCHGCQLFKASSSPGADGYVDSPRCAQFSECQHRDDCLSALFRVNWPGFTADGVGFEPRTDRQKKERRVRDQNCRRFDLDGKLLLRL